MRPSKWSSQMQENIREYLSRLNWSDNETPPAVDFHMYFQGNTEEESIAPNQWGEGRPSITELYERFKEIAAKPEVERVLVGLHFDWSDPIYHHGFPPAENVHILTSANSAEVENWIVGLEADGIINGWPYGKPRNAPEPSSGYSVFSVCWD